MKRAKLSAEEKLLKHLIEFHCYQVSNESDELKWSVSKCIYELFDSMRCHQLSDEEWESYIVSNKWVYCWAKDKIEKLQNISKNSHKEIFLCTSTIENSYNPQCDVFSNSKYKYFYKLHIKENCYGIKLFELNPCRKNEMECLIKLSYIDSFESLKVRR